MTRPVTALAPLLLLLTVLAACEDRGRRGLRDPPGIDPDPVPPIPVALQIDYRVIGTDVRSVQITYFSSAQGTTQTTTDLPWFLSYQTREDSTFVYLSAEAPMSDFLEGTLIVQVFVDGVLFREARSSGFSPSVTVSGEVVR